MKLNKTQINVVAKRAAEDIKSAIAKFNQNIEKLDNLVIDDFLNKHQDLKNYVDYLHTTRQYNVGYVKEYIVRTHPDLFKGVPDKKQYSYSLETTIAEDLVLGTIDGDDVESLLQSIVEKYTK